MSLPKGIYKEGEGRYKINLSEVEEVPVKLYNIPEIMEAMARFDLSITMEQNISLYIQPLPDPEGKPIIYENKP